MNNVNKTGIPNYKDYELPPKEEGLINKTLPFSIFLECLSYLNDKDIQSARLVSYLWNEASIDTAKRRKFSVIKDFTNFLCKNLLDKSYEAQKEKILTDGRNILDFVNLSQIKLSMYESKESILNILKDLKEEDLRSLEEVSKSEGMPEFFENVFDLTKIYKELDEAKTIANEEQKHITFKKISKALSKSGSVEKALEVANMIPDECYNKCVTFQEISKVLLDSGNIEKALEIAIMIPKKDYASPSLYHISRALLESRNIEKAIEVAKKIPGESFKSAILKDISMNFLTSGNADKALEVANMIPEKDFKPSTLKHITIYFFTNGNIEKAIEIANMIPNDSDDKPLIIEDLLYIN